MKKIAFIILLVLTACTMSKRKDSSEYYPRVYFEGDQLALDRAIYNGETKELKNLIKENKIDLNKLGKEGYTLLFYALEIEEYDMVKILLENGADPNVATLRTYVPGAGKQPEPEIQTNIELACYSNYNIDYLKLLLLYGANVNDTRAGSPVTRAVNGDQRDKIKFLIKNGANLNLIPEQGTTPLVTAGVLRRWDLIELFLDAGTDPFLDDNGSNLQKEIQNYITHFEGVGSNKRDLKHLIRRLQKEGMEFDFSKAKFRMD